ncbi:hypothetical protein NDU88_003061 [Pleurodeles waltl]|uniref:Uncharacterized protein n=1 Tax=Pleurodeles waltl TaxID=8319 RepID=A0AAV7LEA9_PLEWA|nr:hypothetical protein NDU88_003061 [Pleurodeles waltl]
MLRSHVNKRGSGVQEKAVILRQWYNKVHRLYHAQDQSQSRHCCSMHDSTFWRRGVGLSPRGSVRADSVKHTSAPCCAYPTPRLVRAACLLLKWKAQLGPPIIEPPAAPRIRSGRRPTSRRHTLTVLPVPAHRPQQPPR